jgi:transcriptional regulator with XRE-family HTH domain
MANAAAFPDFAGLFDGLLVAADLSAPALARRWHEATGRATSADRIDACRRGVRRPTYEFVSDLLEYNLLGFEQDRITPGDGDRPPGPDRVAMFESAGLIEVTPGTTAHWNASVLAEHARYLASQPTRLPRWAEVANRLVAFHTQGERTTLAEFAAGEAHALPGRRLETVLAQGRATDEERQAVYRLVGLTPAQARYVEDGVAAGSIPLTTAARDTPFAVALRGTLQELADAGVSRRGLAARSHTPGDPGVSQGQLSEWASGRRTPTLEGLRRFVRALRPFTLAPNPVLSPADVDRLVEAAGLRPEVLTDTTHDVIAQIGPHTQIKPLLRAIRSAADLEVPSLGGEGLPVPSRVREWERDGTAALPSADQVRELLHRYNRILNNRSLPELSASEIESVTEVAERTITTAGRQRVWAERVGRRPVLSPTFGDTPLPD